MGRGLHVRVGDLSGWAKAQVLGKIGGCASGASGAPLCAPGRQGKAKGHPGRADAPEGVLRVPVRVPNKAEAEYNDIHLGGRGVYEAVTLRLPGGSRYTADWMTVEGGRVTLHEVKGAYRLGSHGRAATAFRECVRAFPMFGFVWAKKGKGKGWVIRRVGSDAR